MNRRSFRDVGPPSLGHACVPLEARANRCTRWVAVMAMAWALGGWAGPAAVAGDIPDDLNLLQLVHADAGLCMEATDLATAWPRLRDGEIARRLKLLPMYEHWVRGPQFQQFMASRIGLESLVGEPLDRFLLRLAGRHVVLAIRTHGAEPPTGVLLSRAQSAKDLASALALWKQLENRTTREHQRGGRTYFESVRVENGVDQNRVFYLVEGPILALSEQRQEIVDVCQRLAARAEGRQVTGADGARQPGTDVKASASSVAETESYREARAALAGQPSLTLHVRPRAWDELTQLKAGLASSDAGQRMAAQFWSGCRWVTVGVQVGDRPRCELRAGFDARHWPAAWRGVIDTLAQPSKAAPHMPADALAVAYGRWDFDALARTLVASTDPQVDEFQKGRRILKGLCGGWDAFDDALPSLGPDWGAYVVPRAEAPEACGLQGLVVLGLKDVSERPLEEGRSTRPTLRQGLRSAGEFGLNLASVAYNANVPEGTAYVRSELFSGETRLATIEGLPAIRPTLSVTNEWIVAASQPSAIQEFLAPEETRASLPGSLSLGGRTGATEPRAGLIYVNLAAAGQWLDREMPNVARRLASWKGLSIADTERRLRKLREVLRVLDVAYVTLDVGADQLRLVLGADADPPAEDNRPSNSSTP